MSTVISSAELELTSNIRMFKGMTDEERAVLLGHAVVEELSPKYLLFSQGDKADRFYIVLDGQVKLYITNAEGEENVLEVFNPVSSFAEAAMFASGRFPVSGETVSTSRVIRVDREPLLKALESKTDIAWKLLRQMTLAYSKLRSQIIHLKSQSPAQRLGAFFLSLAEESGEGKAVQLPYDKYLIAARLGMRPESLSRIMLKLKDVGVENEKDILIVKDLEALKVFCREV